MAPAGRRIFDSISWAGDLRTWDLTPCPLYGCELRTERSDATFGAPGITTRSVRTLLGELLQLAKYRFLVYMFVTGQRPHSTGPELIMQSHNSMR